MAKGNAPREQLHVRVGMRDAMLSIRCELTRDGALVATAKRVVPIPLENRSPDNTIIDMLDLVDSVKLRCVLWAQQGRLF